MSGFLLIPKSAYARNILTYVAFNVGTIAAVLGFVYYSTIGVIENEVSEVVETEIRALEDEYRAGGLVRLRSAVSRRVETADGDAIYLLTAPSNQPIVGNLRQWPETITTDGAWTILSLVRNDTGENILVGARAFSLGLGSKILVGRDMRARRDFQDTLTEAMIGALIVVLILATVGGVIFSRLVLRRLRAIDRTARSIMQGDRSQRIPLTGRNDEFDQMAETLNEMLGKVDDLIEELRVATESMAHDLRSPLTRLRGHLEQTHLKLDEQSSTGQDIVKAISETDRVLKDLNALLNVARLETGMSENQMKKTSVAELLDDVCELYGPLAEDHDMTLVPSVSIEEEFELRMNAQLMAQAVSNLIENAIKYAGSGKTIIVSAEKQEDKLFICISDNGSGIPEENREKAVQRFARLSPERQEGGLGLGLYLVSVICRIHKFHLKLEDNHPGLRAKIIVPLTE